MIVFGDHVRVRDPRRVIRALAGMLVDLGTMPAGLTRHAAIVSAFIEASELAQALADVEARDAGFDRRGRLGEAAMGVVTSLARDVIASWDAGFAAVPDIVAGRRVLDALARERMPAFVHLRRPEGYAFYAVYPEAYLVAARAAAAARPGPRRVVGIRSIGTGLAAIVAEALDAPRPLTVRPTGDPYRRQVHVAPSAAAEWTDVPDVTVAIVDEGPGLSGSSFGAVADAVEAHGVSRIECFPSHAGELGPFALPKHRERWHRVPRHVVDIDELLLRAERPHALAGWVEELVGTLEAPLVDISAGRWRVRRYPDVRQWPPSVTYQERRKFLAHTARGSYLVRFVGLGRDGDRALSRARTLAAAGFSPDVVGLCHGFLVERWLTSTRSLDPRRTDRGALVDRLGHYLALRARSFPAADRGASLERLLEMARHNTMFALGASAAARLDRWTGALSSLSLAVRPIEVDARLHAWEWLEGAGELLKTDAIDHCAAHDLVGCQDVTWDIAGAEVELSLAPAEVARVTSVLRDASDVTPDPGLFALMRVCYVAFQLGRHHLAIDTADIEEGLRLRAAVDGYATRLAAALGV